MGDMVGADADVLTATARRFGRSSATLLRHRAQLATIYDHAGWVGDDADRSRVEWSSVSAPALMRTSEFLRDLEARLLAHAAEQQQASAAASTANRSGPGRAGDLIDDVVGFAGDLRETVDDLFDDLLDDLFGGSDGAGPPRVPVELDGLRPTPFVAPADGRDAVVAAMEGLADEGRIGRDEIEIRALDNGRYVVVLPGVTDLSAGVHEFVHRVKDDPFGVADAGRDAIEMWSDNDEPTVRKMRYAYEAALRDDTTVNEYSVVTIGALQAAGVPAGADVMIIGHSFGAYTAMDLAADPHFNVAHGEAVTGYHVDVTHVVAAGAETDWRFDEVPAGTNTLVVNNRFDGVYRAEDVLHGDGDARHPGHLEQNFWGGWQGFGHDEHNYIDWLSSTGNDDVERWLADAGADYAAGGTRVSARVLDPNQ